MPDRLPRHAPEAALQHLVLLLVTTGNGAPNFSYIPLGVGGQSTKKALVMRVIKIEGGALRRGGPCARPRVAAGCGLPGGHKGRPYAGEYLCRPFNLVDAR